MLGLPGKTDINKQLPKKLIYEKFGMSAADREKFDQDISKLFITNELSPATLQVQDGKEIHSFFVVLVELKTRKYNEKSILAISRLIPQHMIFALKVGSEIQIATVLTRLLHTAWMHGDQATLTLEGLSMDTIWQNIIIQIGDIELDGTNTVEQQITIDEKRDQREKHIEQLEKLARKETQPRKKLELFEMIQTLKIQGE